MEFIELVESIRDYGYIGIFLWLWIGGFVAPIPNEVIVTSIGFFASENILIPWRLFIVTYLGILFAVTTSYAIGRFTGKTLLLLLKRRKKSNRKIERAIKIIEKYNTLALAFCYFVPGIRILIPFLFGFSKLAYWKFASILYSSIFIWVSVIFSVGYFAGEDFIAVFIKYYDLAIGISASIIVIILIVKIKRTKTIRRILHSRGR